jgi:diaminohydroxyphosphoribosylaminopyrimidine deaminase/5-amino-6-(5-phosphoribosylamino)uracil reductase
MPNNNHDLIYLNQALNLAKIRRGFCSPNPSVGAVITLENKILATGYHLACGSPHAEIDALKKLSMHAPGATIYITLEPCCHWGKTPPCTDALIQAGIKRVVYSYADPNPKVAGKGVLALQEQGIHCDHVPLPEITAFYASYHHWLQTKTPFITAKIALTLDGKIAGKLGERIQITGQALQEFTHALRKTADAILTTVKTILHDDPQLNARTANEIIAKPIYILDSKLDFPQAATLLKTAKSLTLFHATDANPIRQQALIEQGIRCIAIDKNKDGLDLKQVIHLIGQDGIHDLWIEAGGKCFSAFATQQLLQRAFIYIAPRCLGEGQAAFENNFSLNLTNTKIHWQQFGNDVLCDIHW